MRIAIAGRYPYIPNTTFFARVKSAAAKTKEKVVFMQKKTVKKITRKRQFKRIEAQRHSKVGTVAKFFFFFLVMLISSGIFASVLRGVPGNPDDVTIKNTLEKRSQPFELSPERGRYVIDMSLDEDKSFALSAALRDVAYPDVGYTDGRFYSYFAPGISLIAYPLYELGKQFDVAQVATFSTISLFALLNMFTLYKICRKIFGLPTWASLFAGIVFAFSSTSLSYANTLYQHHVTTFFILSSFYAVWKFAQRGRWSFLWSIGVWINYALAILIDYPNAILMLPVMVYLLIETIHIVKTNGKTLLNIRLGSILTIIFFAVITGLHGYYNYVNFGSPLRVSQSLIGYKEIKQFHLLDGKAGLERYKQFEAAKQPVGFFKEDNLPKGVFVLLVESDKGLFFFAPIFLIALLDLFHILPRINRKYGVLMATVALNIFLYASFDDPWGGYAYGPRYLIPTMGILSIFVAEWLVVTKKKLLMKAVTFILFLFSSAIAVLGALTTNSVPPGVEAVALHSSSNYLLNLSILQKGISSSYLYNTYFNSLSLTDYYFIIYGSILFLGFSTLFIYPLFSSHDN